MTGRLILASQSQARQQMLKAAGVAFEAQAVDLDEVSIAGFLISQGKTPAHIAQALATEKAKAAKATAPDLVLGSDQTLELDGSLYGKAATLDEARARLRLMSGQAHHLHSGVALVRNGQLVWSTTDSATLHVRPLSDAFIDTYLADNQAAALQSAGGYWLEGQGVQLFDRIEGDYFTILGMPLLEVLGSLREQGMIAS